MKSQHLLTFVFLTTALLHTNPVSADIIRLKSGFTLEGNVTYEDENRIIVEVHQGKISLEKRRIHSIEERPFFARKKRITDKDEKDIQQLVEEMVNDFKEYMEVEPNAEPLNPSSIQIVSDALESIDTDTIDELSNIPEIRELLDSSEFKEIFEKIVGTSDFKEAVKTSSTIVFTIIGIFILFHFYFALCLYLIAHKTSTHFRWMAWFPGFQIILLFMIANRSIFWLGPLFVLAYFNEFAGGIGFLILSINVHFRIAKSRGKSGWLGFLALIPIINIPVWGYLAFSSSD